MGRAEVVWETNIWKSSPLFTVCPLAGTPPLWVLVSLSFMLLLLLLSRFSRVRLCATPWTAAYQASPSMRFSRQEHWSGLPFPSPMHESEKWKVKVKSLSRVWLLVTPWTAAYQAPPSMGFSRQQYWSGVPLSFINESNDPHLFEETRGFMN